MDKKSSKVSMRVDDHNRANHQPKWEPPIKEIASIAMIMDDYGFARRSSEVSM